MNARPLTLGDLRRMVAVHAGVPDEREVLLNDEEQTHVFLVIDHHAISGTHPGCRDTMHLTLRRITVPTWIRREPTNNVTWGPTAS
jgi:hypothetical protein